MLPAKEIRCEVRKEAFYFMERRPCARSYRAEGTAKQRLRGRELKGVLWEGQTPGVSEESRE